MLCWSEISLENSLFMFVWHIQFARWIGQIFWENMMTDGSNISSRFPPWLPLAFFSMSSDLEKAPWIRMGKALGKTKGWLHFSNGLGDINHSTHCFVHSRRWPISWWGKAGTVLGKLPHLIYFGACCAHFSSAPQLVIRTVRDTGAKWHGKALSITVSPVDWTWHV